MAAGPQRAIETTWASLAGGPYVLVQQGYAPSFCLYHHILDADTTMQTGPLDSYAAAITAYRAAADDPRLVACWIRPNEVDELRAYALLPAGHGPRLRGRPRRRPMRLSMS